MTVDKPSLLTLADVRAAADLLAGIAARTPVLTSRSLDQVTGASIALKCESFQRTGSFKFRGAYNLMASLGSDELAGGVCTVSSGNHAQAVALAARLLGTRAAVLMPSDAPASKVAATRGYGAEVEFYDRSSMSQVDAGKQFHASRQMTFVTAYDDRRIAAGAGTAALELFDDAGPFDLIVAPIGGGGGIAGYATVAKALAPSCCVVGVEAAGGGPSKQSLAAGRRMVSEVPPTIADGLMLDSPGAFPFAVMQECVDEIVLVDNDEILDAMVLLFERLKIVVEPSGAVALAAVLAGRIVVEGARIGVIVSGGNIALDRFVALVGERG